jgi:outer membrane protein OmpA-like peptidoglycan-associated protein
MMTLRAGRRALQLGFAALCGIGGTAMPAAAQSYLDDNGGSVTVDYGVLGQGAGPGAVARAPLPGGALPSGSCSCANAPLGVIAATPRPTFTNPFGNMPIAQAPAVPPGFMAYSQAVGSGSSGSTVVLRAPSETTQMAAGEPAPVDETPAPSTPTANEGNAATAPSTGEALPPTTKTQSGSASSAAAAPSGTEPPAQPDTMPTTVPSPVEQPPAEATPSEPPAKAKPAETQTAETPPTTPPAAADSTQPPEQPTQEAAVKPAAPAEGATPPAEGGGALPAGATRILYTGESDDVPAASSGELDKLSQDMLANQDKRVQVMSYAAGTEDTESKARRKSLARGLAIRSYLIKAGVPSTRIDVRALGNKADGGPADRVDIVPAS